MMGIKNLDWYKITRQQLVPVLVALMMIPIVVLIMIPIALHLWFFVLDSQ